MIKPCPEHGTNWKRGCGYCEVCSPESLVDPPCSARNASPCCCSSPQKFVETAAAMMNRVYPTYQFGDTFTRAQTEWMIVVALWEHDRAFWCSSKDTQ